MQSVLVRLGSRFCFPAKKYLHQTVTRRGSDWTGAFIWLRTGVRCKCALLPMAPRNSSHSENSSSRSKRVSRLDKDSEEYRKHRERNNLAVKRSRTKSKMRAQETQAKVAQLRAENESLNAKIKILNKELSFLKDLFLAHAGATGNRSLEGVDLSFLNEDPGSMSEAKSSIVKDEGM